MDSTELMIYDWVRIKGCSENYSRVTELYVTTDVTARRMLRVVNNYNYCISETEVEPIEITKEFLKKNPGLIGFFKAIHRFKYVHELQHYLRLRGYKGLANRGIIMYD